MQLLYYIDYEKKKNSPKNHNIKQILEMKERHIKNGTINYRNISDHKKIVNLAKSKGYYRMSVFLYDDVALIVDFDIKQKIDNDYVDKLFPQSDEFYIEYIKNNKVEEEKKIIDLNPYKPLLEMNEKVSDVEVCFESFEFAKKIKALYKNKEVLNNIFDLIQVNILGGDKKSDFENLNNLNTIFKIKDEKYTILFKMLVDDDIYIIHFIDIFDKNLEIDKEKLENLDKIVTKSELAKEAKKAYPLDIFLEDFNEWREYIVKNSEGNIALSPEEENILIQLKSYQNDKKFPFFINGRAGSGKSTILQYLFADYIVEFLLMKENMDKTIELEYPPLYLTYNDRLKEKAIEKVVSIILAKTKKKIKEKLNLKRKDVIHKKVELFFKSFDTIEGDNFLEELIDKNNRLNSLRDKTKMNFIDIKNYFQHLIDTKGKTFQKLYNPELIWYVIRSFIKGRAKIEDDKIIEMRLEDYKELPKNIKTIQDTTFKTIYNEFYLTYRNYLKDENKYDDLDLVMEVFKQNAFDRQYSVIFCDEAQDFTKIEFDLILNLNVFLNKDIKISNLDYKNIPIVFAGDPFQTINPTGFSFEYLKANVYESYLKKNLTEDKIELNLKELSFNYRSDDNIVKFSNSIQILRGILLRDKNITLQTRWLRNDDNGNNLLFFENNDKHIRKFLKKKDYLNFIFPIDKKNDTNYRGVLSEDELLIDIFDNQDKEYDTPIKVKGLEFKWVVLYRFGDYFLEKFNEDIDKLLNEGFKDKEASLSYEYFFNNFYVAITRAKSKLLIIDSDEAYNQFWSKINVEKLIELYEKLNGKVDVDSLSGFLRGEKENLSFEENDEIEWTIEKIKTLLFDRYDDEVNKIAILNEVKRILSNNNKLNEVYELIFDGYHAEYTKKYLKSVKKLMKGANKGKTNDELANSDINLLVRKSFENLYKAIPDENVDKDKILDYIKKYKTNFENLGIRFKTKMVLMETFLKGKYGDTLKYIKDELLPKEDVLDFIIQKSIQNLDLNDLVVYVTDLYNLNRNYISSKEIIDIIREKYNEENFNDYKTLLKLFEIGDLKKANKELFCKVNIEINPSDIDCLIFRNEFDKVVEILQNEDVDISEYTEKILFHLIKNNEYKYLNMLNMNEVIDIYKEHKKDMNLEVWGHILKEIFKNKESLNDETIEKVMKFIQDIPLKSEKVEYFQVLIDVLKEKDDIINTTLFDNLITLFSSVIIKICDTIYLLEKTINFDDTNNVKKLLGFYKYYVIDKKNTKYKPLIASRYLKIRYETKFDIEEYYSHPQKRNWPTWLDFLKRRFKFLHIDTDESTLVHIPMRTDLKICNKLVRLKKVSDVYRVMILNIDSSTLPQKPPQPEPKPDEDIIKEPILEPEPKISQDKSVLTQDNVLEKLEEIQMFIYKNRDNFDDMILLKLQNVTTGLLRNLEDYLK